jgi:hypothetical protein
VEPRREVLFNVDWQRLRMRLLNGWHSQTDDNIKELLHYVGRSTSEHDKFLRVWRCLNLLRAVPLGEVKEVRKRLLTARNGFQIQYDKLRSYGHTWKSEDADWLQVRADLAILYRHYNADFKALKANMERRMAKVGGTGTQVGYMQQKPESAKFIRLMRDVEFEEVKA